MRAFENSLQYSFGVPLTEWQTQPVSNFFYTKGMRRYMDNGVLRVQLADGSSMDELEPNFPYASTMMILADQASTNVSFVSYLAMSRFYVAWEFDCCHRYAPFPEVRFSATLHVIDPVERFAPLTSLGG